MVEISIICLIYKSCKMADKVYESVIKHTPLIKNNKAEFFFVANNPTEEVLKYLSQKKYPFIECWTEVLTDNQMDKMGYAKPNYMRNVYQGYNYGILNAKGKIVVLINSDNLFSDDWLENLLKYSDYKNIVCSTLIEPGKKEFSVFPGAIEKDFGKTIDSFKENEFLKFAKSIKRTGLKLGGAYMPCLFYKEIGILAGLYPEGNIKSDNIIFGDEYFFKKLNDLGVLHITAKDSIVYHLKEGEKSENGESIVKYKPSNYKFDKKLLYKPKNIIVNLSPTIEHREVLSNLIFYVCVFIYRYKNKQELEKQLNEFVNQTYNKLEIIVCLNNNIKYIDDIKEKYPTVKFVKNKYEDLGTQLYHEIYNMNSSFMLFSDPILNYDNNFVENLINIIKLENTFLKNIALIHEQNCINVGYIIFQKNNFTRKMLYWLNIVIDNEKIKKDEKNFVFYEQEKKTPIKNKKITIRKILRFIKRKIILVLRK